jgi:hypothetical protein
MKKDPSPRDTQGAGVRTGEPSRISFPLSLNAYYQRFSWEASKLLRNNPAGGQPNGAGFLS